jgi:CheY-like chemotaxis protein
LKDIVAMGGESVNPCGGLRVLVIEDNADSGEGTELWLRLSGHTVTLALSGRDGIARARHFHPDVVLCDIGLPGGVDGYGVARALRSDPETAGTYLVALTGYGGANEAQACRAAGFDLHLTKPVDPGTLEATIRGLAVRPGKPRRALGPIEAEARSGP